MGDTIRTVVEQAWQQFQAQMVSVLPHVMAALIVLAVGIVFGAIVNRVAAWLLKASQFDRRFLRLGLFAFLERIGISSSSAFAARVLQGAIVFVAAIFALYALDARLASDLAERFLLYLPHLLVGLVILGAGAILARFLARSVLIAAVNNEMRAGRLLSGLTRTGVMVVAVAVACEHLGIGRATVQTGFAILFGGVTVAAAIAVGFGTQDVVRRWLAGLLEPSKREDGGDTIHHW